MAKRMETYFKIAVLSVIICSLTVFGILIVDVEGTTAQKVGAYIVAATFWGSLALEICLIYLCDKERKNLEKEIHRFIALKHAKVGIFSFRTSKEGMMADVVLLIFMVVLIVVIAAKVKAAWIIMTTVSMLLLSFNMHCLLNGKNYRYIKALRKYMEENTRNE